VRYARERNGISKPIQINRPAHITFLAEDVRERSAEPRTTAAVTP